MKTSKYIQTALLLFIFAATLILFLDARSYTFTADQTINPTINVKGYYDHKLLNDFSVVVAEKNSKFWVRKDSINRAYYQHRDTSEVSKSGFSFECFNVKNDTLFVSNVDEKYTLYVNRIIGKENSEIGLLEYYSDTLTLALEKSKVTGSLRNDYTKVLKIEADNHSDINFGRHIVKTIDSITKKVKFIPLDEKLAEAEITLQKYSNLKIPKPQKLIISADETSHYTIFNSNSNRKELVTSSTILIAD